MSQGPDGLKDLWSKLGQTLQSGAKTVVQETKDLGKQGKLRVELVSLENERNRKFADIGRSVHALYKGGTSLPPELADLFTTIDAIEDRIDEKRKDIEALKADEEKAEQKPEGETVEDKPAAKTECPQCGAAIEPGDVFCSKCGARVV